MLAENVMIGDTFVDADNIVIYTIVWEPIVERTTVFCRVQWALDGGMTDRTLPMGIDIPRLVRPDPPPEDPPADPPPEP
jgi:hypothetical protein